MKQLYELKGEGRSIRAIARDLGVSRNSVRKYLRSPQVPQAKEQTPRGSKLDPYKEYLRERLAEGLENCVVLLRELRGRGYTGAILYSKSTCIPFGDRICPRPPGGLRPSRENRLKSIGAASPISPARARRNRFGPSSWS